MAFNRLETSDFVLSSDAISSTLWSNGSPALTTFFSSSGQIAGSSGKFYLTVYLDSEFQGKGYFSHSIKLLINKINQEQPRKDKLYSLVRQSNEKMITISNNKFKFIKFEFIE